MIGCFAARKCLVACLFLDSSQQPTCPQVRHRRRCTHVSPILRHSSQPLLRGRLVLTRSRWLHCISADVLLDDFGGSDMRLGRIAAGFAQGAPLAQKIPALIQLHLDVCQALAFVRSELALLEQPVLLNYQALDMGEYGLVLAMFFHGVPRWMQKGVGAMPNIDPL